MKYITLSEAAQVNQKAYLYAFLTEKWEAYDFLRDVVQWELKKSLPTSLSTYDGHAVLGYWRWQPSSQDEPRLFRLTGGYEGDEGELYIQVMCGDEYMCWWEDWSVDFWEIPSTIIRSDYRPEDDYASKDLFDLLKEMMTPKCDENLLTD